MRRAMLLAAVLALATATTAQAGVPSVTGSYAYEFYGPSYVEIEAHPTVPPTGTFHWSKPSVGATMDGVVTCLVIQGSDAWVAGPLDQPDIFGNTGWAVRVHDGGSPGIGADTAISFADDLATVLAECGRAAKSWTRWLAPVIAGNLTVH